jgi:ABC-type Fe3+-hydroxamate transport system substrate-binding protein
MRLAVKSQGAKFFRSCLRSRAAAIFIILLPLAFSFAGPAGGAAASAQPITISDSLGRSISLPAPARRIVVLSDLGAQLVCALGAEDMVIGRARWVVWPPALAARPQLGLQAQPNLEVLLRWQPDLIIADAHFRHALALLSDYKLPVAIFQAQDLPQLKQAAESLGQALARQSESTRLVDFINEIEDMLEQGLEGLEEAPALMLFCAQGPPYYDLLRLQPLFHRARIASRWPAGEAERAGLAGALNPEWLLRAEAPLNILVAWRAAAAGEEEESWIAGRPELARLAGQKRLKIMDSRYGFNLTALDGLMRASDWAHPQALALSLLTVYQKRLQEEFLLREN